LHQKKQRGGWKEFDNVARELLAFIEKQGTPGVMPTEGELTKASQGSLLGAIKKHGGTHKVAEALGLIVRTRVTIIGMTSLMSKVQF
jgi:hypothetical protein